MQGLIVSNILYNTLPMEALKLVCRKWRGSYLSDASRGIPRSPQGRSSTSARGMAMRAGGDKSMAIGAESQLASPSRVDGSFELHHIHPVPCPLTPAHVVHSLATRICVFIAVVC